MVGAVLSLVVGLGAWVWLRRIRGVQRARVVSLSALAAADIGAIDPEGRSAGASVESQLRVASRR
jgi:hypothetical protein